MAVYDQTTALVINDVQNDFADPAGSLYVRGAQEIIPVVNRELARASAAGALVVYTQDWHPPATPHFKTWPPHCVKGSWGAELHPLLLRIPGATLILKGTQGEDGYSAFSYADPVSGRTHKTALEGLLRSHGIRRVVLAGLTTDYCVKHSALDALGAGFEVLVLQDGVRAVNVKPGDGVRAIDEIARKGAEIVTSDELHRPPFELGTF